jgi:hypothetical protein
MNRIILLSIFSLNLFAQITFTPKELLELNQERKANGYRVIKKSENADQIIQDELDYLLEEKIENLKNKKLKNFPIMEKLGARNLLREKSRKNKLRDINEAKRVELEENNEN